MPLYVTMRPTMLPPPFGIPWIRVSINNLPIGYIIVVVLHHYTLSKTDASGNNNGWFLSPIEPIGGRKIGRRVDTLFKSGSEELGYNEIGAGKDQTKQIEDSNFKMPFVLRDMLVRLTYTKELLHSVHIVGYDMTG